MTPLQIDIDALPQLGTAIGLSGSIGGEMGGDELFEYVVGIAILLHEMYPR